MRAQASCDNQSDRVAQTPPPLPSFFALAPSKKVVGLCMPFYFFSLPSNTSNNTTHPKSPSTTVFPALFKTGIQETTTTTMAARFLDMALDDVAKSRAANNRSPVSRRGARGAGVGGAGAGSGRDSPSRSNRASPYSVSSPRTKEKT